MLKKWGILLIILAMISIVTVGCGSKKPPEESKPAEEQPVEEPTVEDEEKEEEQEEQDEDMDEMILTDGVYTGVGQGFNGEIKIEVKIVGGEVTSIEAIEHNETENIGGAAFAELIKSALDSHDDDIDTVSGASKTTAGFLEALDDVHEQAEK